VGSHVARALVQRGDQVRVTVRRRSRPDNLDTVDAERVVCDVLDRRAVRRALRGVDRVFHVAGHTSLRASREQLFRVNAEGTRIVMEEALRAGVERVVHTSSVAAIGPAPRGRPPTSASRSAPAAWTSRTCTPSARRRPRRSAPPPMGLPVVVVCPGHVLGRGDLYRSSTELVLRFLRRQIPAYVDGALNIVDAEDVARGHLLPTSAAGPASATSWATATSRWTASSPISGDVRGSPRRR
jgi:dihydroflavonol-4-reductase